jgi:enoyl-[acyl-carrier protein] reductase I
VSTYSLAALARGFAPLLKAAGGGSIVGLDFDATVAWPSYDWMGVAKAGLESCCRYVARDLGEQGTRVNLVAAGPLKTMAAKQIAGFSQFEQTWARRAPLGWDVNDTEPVARVVCALLSDWMPAVTGEVVHADGGAHAMGADVR